MSEINIIDALKSEKLIGGLPEFQNLKSFKSWIAALKAVFAIRMTKTELEIFRKHTGRQNPPKKQVRKAVFGIGRRAAKSLMGGTILSFLGTFHEWEKPQGGRLIALAVDKKQAGIVFDYCRRILTLPTFEGLIQKEMAEEIHLKNGLILEVRTCNYRSLRGPRYLCAVLDEVAFMRDETSANPAEEIITALAPSLGESSDSLLLMISSVYSASGVLYETVKEGFGKEREDELIWIGSTPEMNPLYPKATINKELQRDHEAAQAEFFSVFRSGLSSFLPPEIVDEAVSRGRHELPPNPGKFKYHAFVDVSGGVRDAYTLAICMKDEDRIIQAVMRGWYPRFNPQIVTREAARIVKEYGISKIYGDRYSARWCVEAWENEGVSYEAIDMDKSQIYLESLSYFTRNQVEILDHPRLIGELKALERRAGRVRDIVDHGPSGFDDHANSLAGCIVITGRSDRGGAYFSTAPISMIGGSERH